MRVLSLIGRVVGVGLVTVSVGGLLACSKEEDVKADKPVPPVEDQTVAAKQTPRTVGKANPEVVNHLKQIVAGCTINVESGQAYSCKNKETNAMQDWVRKEAPTDLFESLVVTALGEDEQLGAAAVAEMSALFTTKDDEWKKKNATPAAVEGALSFVEKTQGGRAAKMAPYAVHLAFLTGNGKKLFPIIEGHPTAAVKWAAYENYMTYGRLEGFSELERVTKDEHDAKVIAAALRAPRKMYKDTAEEKARYCPWAERYLTDTDLQLASAAGYVMVKCGGEYIDRLLEEGKKRVAAGQFQPPLSQVYREPCFQFIKNVTDKAAAEEQCERVYAFLQSVADNEKVEPKVRGMALWNIYYQRRDQATLDLMRKYQKHKLAEVQERAKDAIQSLTTTYKLK